MTFTVFNQNGEIYKTGLTAAEAVEAAATHDGKAFEIRQDDQGFYEIWASDSSRNSYGGSGQMRVWGVFGKTPQEVCEKAIAKYSDFDGYTIKRETAVDAN